MLRKWFPQLGQLQQAIQGHQAPVTFAVPQAVSRLTREIIGEKRVSRKGGFHAKAQRAQRRRVAWRNGGHRVVSRMAGRRRIAAPLLGVGLFSFVVIACEEVYLQEIRVNMSTNLLSLTMGILIESA
jgi:hypothetical protein